MITTATDFYLNLDRWETLSAVERHRGHWEERTRLPSPRLEPVRRQALLQSTWAIGFPGVPLDPRRQETILAGFLAEGEVPEMVRAFRYARAIQFVHGWFAPFPWTGAGAEQLLRILEGRRSAAEPREDHLFLEVKQQSGEVARAMGDVPLLGVAAYGGAIRRDADPTSIETQMLLLGLRLLLLKHGYVQVQFAPIEAVWCDANSASRQVLLGRRPGGADPSPEEELGESLDRWAEILKDAGARAEEAWGKIHAVEPRSALQEAILTAAYRNGRITAGDVLKLTGANRNTVKDNMTRLVRAGLLRKTGEKRGTIYLPV